MMQPNKLSEQLHYKIMNVEKDCKDIFYGIKKVCDSQDHSNLKILNGHLKMARVLLERADHYQQQALFEPHSSNDNAHIMG